MRAEAAVEIDQAPAVDVQLLGSVRPTCAYKESLVASAVASLLGVQPLR